jgi:hypothetical protein
MEAHNQNQAQTKAIELSVLETGAIIEELEKMKRAVVLVEEALEEKLRVFENYVYRKEKVEELIKKDYEAYENHPLVRTAAQLATIRATKEDLEAMILNLKKYVYDMIYHSDVDETEGIVNNLVSEIDDRIRALREKYNNEDIDECLYFDYESEAFGLDVLKKLSELGY